MPNANIPLVSLITILARMQAKINTAMSEAFQEIWTLANE